MSISSIQKRRAFNHVSRALFSNGQKPRVVDILNFTSKYFAQHPAGAPLVADAEGLQPGVRSSVSDFNRMIAYTALNIDVAYEVANEQIESLMMLTSMLRAHLDRLEARRSTLTATIDDYLFSIFNTDGYFYSVSDSFNDTSKTDLALSSAYVDTTSGQASIPFFGDLSQKVDANFTHLTSINAVVDHKAHGYTVLSDMSNAFDGLTNTVWQIEVETDAPKEVMVGVRIAVGSNDAPVMISRMEFNPYGIEPVQVIMATVGPEGETLAPTGSTTQDAIQLFVSDGAQADVVLAGFNGRIFGDKFETSAHNMVFQDSLREITAVNILMRKITPDYETVVNGQVKQRYIFGAKDIVLTKQVYDSSATFVSRPISLPSELSKENAIDAISVVADQVIPADTSIDFFIARDTGNEKEIGDFSWQKIDPLIGGDNSDSTLIKMGGSFTFSRDIRSEPEGNELQLIPINTLATAADTDINPLRGIPGIDRAYRIAAVEDDVIPSSTTLEEGVNTTRILYTTYDATAVDSLDFWAPYIKGDLTATTTYGRIDTGFGFFDGVSIGEFNRSVYVETFIELPEAAELKLKNLRKTNENSKLWDVRAFLNGREVAYVPSGVGEAVTPWGFKKGLNQIILLINIPTSSDTAQLPYQGQIDLVAPDQLYQYGTVKLATWQYVDLFKMQYNEEGEPFTFTIYNKEIISRRPPTDNFRLRFTKLSGNAPTAIRLRADLNRASNNPHTTPYLNLYRLRFAYK
jgi:hypothetical protein